MFKPHCLRSRLRLHTIPCLLAVVLAAGLHTHAEESSNPDAPVTYPSIKGHPLPDVSTFLGVHTEAKLLPRDCFVDASVVAERTLRQATKIEVATATSYNEQNFNEELLSSSERRLAVDAVVLNTNPGSTDTAIINQRPFSTGDQVPVQVDTAEPREFKRLANERRLPYLDLGGTAAALKAPVKSGAPKINSTLCVFLEVGRITPKGVSLRFPNRNTDVVVLPYNPVIHLDTNRTTIR